MSATGIGFFIVAETGTALTGTNFPCVNLLLSEDTMVIGPLVDVTELLPDPTNCTY